MLRTALAVAIIILALGGSVWLLFGPGSAPYLGVDQLLARRAEMVDRPMRLAGRLDGLVTRADAASAAVFTVSASDARISVEYSGHLPADLQSGRELLLDGRLREDGVFVADRLLTQCTSRYKARLEGEQTQ